MKRAIKICLTLAGALFALGLVLHLAGSAMGGRRESVQYYEDHWENIFQSGWGHISVNSDGVHVGGENGIHVDSDGVSIGGDHGIHVGHHDGNGYSGKKQLLESGELTGITSIEVDVDCADIWIQEGESTSVSLDWNLSNYTMSYEVKDGVLKVEDESWGSSKAFSDIVISCKVLVTVPSGTVLDRLDLYTDMGDIAVDAAVSAKKVNLSVDMGDISCLGLQAKELEAESALGDIMLHLPGGREDYTWELETSMGELLLDGEEQSGGLGTITNYGGSGKSKVEVTAALGNVEVYFS